MSGNNKTNGSLKYNLSVASFVGLTALSSAALWMGITNPEKLKEYVNEKLTGNQDHISERIENYEVRNQSRFEGLENKLNVLESNVQNVSIDVIKNLTDENGPLTLIAANIRNYTEKQEGHNQAINQRLDDTNRNVRSIDKQIEHAQNRIEEVENIKIEAINNQTNNNMPIRFGEIDMGKIVTDNKTPYSMVTDPDGKIITDMYGFPVIYWTETGKVISRDNIRTGGQIAAGRNIIPADYGVVGMWKATLGGKHRFTYINENNQLETKLFDDKTYLTQILGGIGSITRTPTLGLKQLSNDYIETAVDHWSYKYSVGLVSRLVTNIADGIVEPFAHTEMELANATTSLLGDAFGHYLIVEVNDEGQYAFNSIDLGPEGCIDDKILQLGGATIRQGAKVFMIYAMAGGISSGSSSSSSSGSSYSGGGTSPPPSGGIGGGFTGGPEF